MFIRFFTGFKVYSLEGPVSKGGKFENETHCRAACLSLANSTEVDKFDGSVAGGTGKDAGCNAACDLGLRLGVVAICLAPAEIQASKSQPPEY